MCNFTACIAWCFALDYAAWDFNTKNAIFALPDGKELTPEEEARLREDNKWAEEEPELAPEILGSG